MRQLHSLATEDRAKDTFLVLWHRVGQLQLLAVREDTASNSMPFPWLGGHCWSKMQEQVIMINTSVIPVAK